MSSLDEHLPPIGPGGLNVSGDSEDEDVSQVVMSEDDGSDSESDSDEFGEGAPTPPLPVSDSRPSHKKSHAPPKKPAPLTKSRSRKANGQLRKTHGKRKRRELEEADEDIIEKDDTEENDLETTRPKKRRRLTKKKPSSPTTTTPASSRATSQHQTPLPPETPEPSAPSFSDSESDEEEAEVGKSESDSDDERDVFDIGSSFSDFNLSLCSNPFSSRDSDARLSTLPSARIQLSGFHRRDRAEVMEMLEAMRTARVPVKMVGMHPPSSYRFTHLVVGNDERRTLKVLVALARGVPVVRVNWLRSCRDKGSVVDHVPFLVRKWSKRLVRASGVDSVGDEEDEEEHPSPPHLPQPLRGWKVALIGSLNHPELKGLIPHFVKALGGSFSSGSRPVLSNLQWADTTVVNESGEGSKKGRIPRVLESGSHFSSALIVADNPPAKTLSHAMDRQADLLADTDSRHRLVVVKKEWLFEVVEKGVIVDAEGPLAFPRDEFLRLRNEMERAMKKRNVGESNVKKKRKRRVPPPPPAPPPPPSSSSTSKKKRRRRRRKKRAAVAAAAAAGEDEERDGEGEVDAPSVSMPDVTISAQRKKKRRKKKLPASSSSSSLGSGDATRREKRKRKKRRRTPPLPPPPVQIDRTNDEEEEEDEVEEEIEMEESPAPAPRPPQKKKRRSKQQKKKGRTPAATRHRRKKKASTAARRKKLPPPASGSSSSESD